MLQENTWLCSTVRTLTPGSSAIQSLLSTRRHLKFQWLRGLLLTKLFLFYFLQLIYFTASRGSLRSQVINDKLKGSRSNTACQHWRGICRIMYCFSLNWAVFIITLDEVENVTLHNGSSVCPVSSALFMRLVVKATLSCRTGCSEACFCPQNSKHLPLDIATSQQDLTWRHFVFQRCGPAFLHVLVISIRLVVLVHLIVSALLNEGGESVTFVWLYNERWSSHPINTIQTTLFKVIPVHFGYPVERNINISVGSEMSD